MKSLILAALLSIVGLSTAHAQTKGAYIGTYSNQGSAQSSNSSSGGSSVRVSRCEQMEQMDAQNGLVTDWGGDCHPSKDSAATTGNVGVVQTYPSSTAHRTYMDYILTGHPINEYVLVIMTRMETNTGRAITSSLTNIDHFEREADCQAAANYALKRQGVYNAFCLLRPHHPVP
jgi:hypothetical protein